MIWYVKWNGDKGCYVYRSLASLSILFGQVVRGLSAGGRVFEHMEVEPRVPLRGGHTLPTDTIQGVICFEKVSFAYPTRADQVSRRGRGRGMRCCIAVTLTHICVQPVLTDMSLELPGGQVTALCGLSGAGKW